VARTFQHVRLRANMTCLENVAIGTWLRGRAGVMAGALALSRNEDARCLFEAQRQLDRVGLGALASAPAGSLALGQQRVLEIARALAADPSLLMLDEPAAGLRLQEKQALAALLRELKSQGVTVLVVEHDMDFVMNLVDRVVVLQFGTKIAEGTPDVVRRDRRVIEAYLGGLDD
jgi:branched-chain amino acid transport system permease protein